MWITDLPGKRDTFLSVRLRTALLQRLDAIAANLRRSRSSLVEQAIEEYILRHSCPRPGDPPARMPGSTESST